MHRWYVEGLSRPDVAGFAPVVFDLAAAGDAAASAVVAAGADELALLVATASRRLALTNPAAVCVGSLLEKRTDYRAALDAALAARGLACTTTLPAVPPEGGAALLALAAAGVNVDATVMETLQEGLR